MEFPTIKTVTQLKIQKRQSSHKTYCRVLYNWVFTHALTNFHPLFWWITYPSPTSACTMNDLWTLRNLPEKHPSSEVDQGSWGAVIPGELKGPLTYDHYRTARQLTFSHYLSIIVMIQIRQFWYFPPTILIPFGMYIFPDYDMIQVWGTCYVYHNTVMMAYMKYVLLHRQ